ncbi:MAG: response regulator transcription factor [Cytophagales bacterium]|nr:response regulator transcription factor [Cytophagales bacterium]
MTILVVDDHSLFRNSLIIALQSRGFSETTFLQARTGEEAVEVFKKQWVDLVLLDVQMPRMNGYETATVLLEMRNSAKIIALTMVDTIEAARHFFDIGVKGYVTKDVDLQILCQAIRLVDDGGTYFLAEGKSNVRTMKSDKPSQMKFSAQELKLIEHLAKGESTDEIAKKMSLSKRTIEFYKQRAMAKAHVQTSSELITFIYRNGLN